MPELVLENLGYSYEKGFVFRNLSMAVEGPCIIGIRGSSGSGKSTLLKLVAGILTPTEGRIDRSNGMVAWVPQDSGLYPWLTIEQNIALPLRLRNAVVPQNERAQRVSEVIEQLGLEHLRHRLPTAVSGGECQRAAIARAVAASAALLLLDEPYASLDPGNRASLSEIIKQVVAEHRLVCLVISHESEELEKIANDIIDFDGITVANSG